VPEWMSTLGAMQRHRTRVISTCSRCRGSRTVDLTALIAQLGADGSLWNRRPACSSCGKPGHYMASPGPGTPMRPLLADERTVGLPPTTIMSDAQRKAFLKSFGFTRRDIVRIKAMAESTTGNYLPAALNDLDVPIRVGACPAGQESRSTGKVLGSWAGRTLLYWDMYVEEREVWARRRPGPRRV